MKTNSTPNSVTGLLSQLDSVCQEYLVDKAPFALPENLKDLIVKVSPYLSVIMAILLVPIILAAVGLTAFLAPLSMMGNYGNPSLGLWGLLTVGLAVVGLVLRILAIPGLFSVSKKGWTLTFYNTLLSLVSGLLSGSFISAPVGALISLYVLYQVKSKYKN